MEIVITKHAFERMQKYNASKEIVLSAIEYPDSVINSYKERRIYQKKLNGYILRVILEEEKEIKTVITVYKSRSKRYEI